MTETKTLLRFMEKYRFTEELSPELRKRILSSKKKAFKNIIKTGNSIPVFFMFFRKVSQVLKKWGLNVSISNSKKLAIALPLFLLLAGAGTFFLVNREPGVSTASSEIQPNSAKIAFVVGSAEIIRGGKSEAAAVNSVIKSGETVRTSTGAMIVLQVSGSANIKVHENTEFVFDSIDESGKTSIDLKNGSLYSKLKKLSKDQSYEIKTMTFTAAVRGTEFLSTSSEKDSGIKVLNGKVSLSAGESIENIADAGNGIKLNKSGKPEIYSLSKKETLLLEKDSVQTTLENIEGKTEEELKLIQQATLDKTAELDKKIEEETAFEKLSPLQKLRALGKPLTMINMRDGSQIAGSVQRSDDKFLYLDTGDGIAKLPVEEILRRTPMK
ncbi:MAG TPA: FecR family protein [Spirochaetota bacterium]|nr:FecR family protein [Spirochaetota bacterium]HPW52273.1 FecR family protein [Spirochaetota bacterium]HPY03650.1 FecR family protein [Spirochaetota bacterium]HQA53390.1 FecR family protein [Spirochaetota bacterium]